jgi:membrane protein implicated in regulation of membrane protease activity
MLLAQFATEAPNNPVAAFIGGTMGIAFWIITYVVAAIALMTIANKLGVENSWLAWIPIANLYLMTQCAGLDWWWLILFFVPCVNIFAIIYVWWKICERRGKPGPLAILMIVPCVGWFVPLYVAFAD